MAKRTFASRPSHSIKLMNQTALCATLLGLIVAPTAAASSEFTHVAIESWQRSGSQVIYARASEDTHEFGEICVQWPTYSFRVPADAFRKRRRFDPSTVEVWSSVGVRGGVRRMTTTVSFELDDADPDEDEHAPSTVRIELWSLGGRLNPTAEVYFQTHSKTQRAAHRLGNPDVNIELNVSTTLPCPSPSGPQLGQAVGDG